MFIKSTVSTCFYKCWNSKLYLNKRALTPLKNTSDEAIAATKYVLSGDSKEVKSYKEKVNKENELLRKREDNIISDPSYENIKQIAGDIRFMRNIVIYWNNI